MSDGKEYEEFVQRLQQALLDSEPLMNQKNVEIERNKKIVDNNGIKREFDLYWEYELAGVIYKTIIECKDYSSSISLEKIDALIGKIRDIPDLKPIFATRIGYQKGAERKAQKNKIDLLIVREQCDEDWFDKDGTPLIRGIDIQMIVNPRTTITNIEPRVHIDWLKANTNLSPENPIMISGVSKEIFFEDLIKNETYSLYDLQNRLNSMLDDKYGVLSHTEDYENAFLVNNDLRLKITSCTFKYVHSKPFTYPFTIDFSKELVGVIEYLNKRSSTAIFKDKIIKDWK